MADALLDLLSEGGPAAPQGEGSFEHVLLLNASFEPLNVIGWRRAVKLIVLDKAEVVEVTEREIHSVTRRMAVPSVVRLTTVSELTCDHVVPRSRGGRTEWSNIVTCCIPCNRRKGGRTPAEAGLHLVKKPVQPTWLWGVQHRFATRRPPKAWHAYLFIGRDREIVS
jgi:5-methylcytosine-specific restriction endonuclease McrA